TKLKNFMDTLKFLAQFSKIEDYLISIAPAFDKKQGIFLLIQYLQSENLITDSIASDLDDILQLRNKIVNSQIGKFILTLENIDKIQKIKQVLNI
ncbi:MAG: hypothetical protein AAB526_01020, partial [Patescibacteria group bacterium]